MKVYYIYNIRKKYWFRPRSRVSPKFTHITVQCGYENDSAVHGCARATRQQSSVDGAGVARVPVPYAPRTTSLRPVCLPDDIPLTSSKLDSTIVRD